MADITNTDGVLEAVPAEHRDAVKAYLDKQTGAHNAANVEARKSAESLTTARGRIATLETDLTAARTAPAPAAAPVAPAPVPTATAPPTAGPTFDLESMQAKWQADADARSAAAATAFEAERTTWATKQAELQAGSDKWTETEFQRVVRGSGGITEDGAIVLIHRLGLNPSRNEAGDVVLSEADKSKLDAELAKPEERVKYVTGARRNYQAPGPPDPARQPPADRPHESLAKQHGLNSRHAATLARHLNREPG
jgi:hypothetical protein